jgi:hypothetical protein
MSMIRYSRSLVFILVGITVLAAVTSSGASMKNAKPRQPVQITIEAVQPGVTPDNIKPGDVVDLVVSAVSHVDTDAMTLTVAIPKGAVLISGDLSWTGPARKGEKRTMPITIRVPQKGVGEITAEMSIMIEGKKAFSASSRFMPGGAKKVKPEQRRPVKKDSRGQGVIEY